MNAITYDTLASAKRLISKGISQAQAEAFAEELRVVSEVDVSHLATKSEMSSFKSELRSDLAEIRADMVKMEMRLQQFILKISTILGAIMVAGFGFLAAIKYFG